MLSTIKNATMSEQVYLYVFWKSAIKFDGVMPDKQHFSQKNDVLYKITMEMFGTFPKSLSDFEKIEENLSKLPIRFKDLIMVYIYSGGNKKIITNHTTHDTETNVKFAKSIVHFLSGSPKCVGSFDRVATRHMS